MPSSPDLRPFQSAVRRFRIQVPHSDGNININIHINIIIIFAF